MRTFLILLIAAGACAPARPLGSLVRELNDPAARKEEIGALVDSFPERAAPEDYYVLVNLLHHGDRRVVAAASRTLARSLTASKEDEGMLRRLLNTKEPEARRAGLDAVQRLWSPEDRAGVLARLTDSAAPATPLPADAPAPAAAPRSPAACLKDFKLDDYLTPEIFAREGGIDLVRQLTCRVTAAKSLKPCERLAGLSLRDPNAEWTPLQLCRQISQTPLLLEALRTNDPSVCPDLTESFENVPAAMRVKACEALFAQGTPAEVCTGAVALAKGVVLTPHEFEMCQNDQRLRGVTSEAACSAPGMTPVARDFCLEVMRRGATCASWEADLARRYCR